MVTKQAPSTVKSTSKALSRAFTMIELIYAIVIISIVAITLPLILVSNAQQVEENLVQEALLITATKAGQVLTYPWDENSNPIATSLAKTQVLTVSASGDTELSRVVGTDYRIGHVAEALRRRMTPATAERNASTIGTDGGDIGFDDVDDFHNTAETTGVASASGYKKAYTLNTTITYVDDGSVSGTNYAAQAINFNFPTTAAAGTTNLKMIEVSTDRNDSTGNVESGIIVMRTYSANIGETDYYKRTY